MWVTGGFPMTHLRKMMLEELQRRNYSENTTRCYIRTVEDFSRRFNCSPDRLGPRHIREYQAELFQKRKFSPNAVAQRLAALRFFYVKTLKKAWSITETPYPKKAVHLPTDPTPRGMSNCSADRRLALLLGQPPRVSTLLVCCGTAPGANRRGGDPRKWKRLLAMPCGGPSHPPAAGYASLPYGGGLRLLGGFAFARQGS